MSCAITRPWSMTVISSASASASSRYCVVSRTVDAVVDERAHDAPHVLALGRVQAGRRLVEEDHRRAADEAGGEVEPAAHAAGVGLRAGRSAASVRSNQSSSSCARARASRPAEVEQPADHAPGSGVPVSVLVDRRVLAGQPDRLADLGAASATTSWPSTRARAPVGAQQRGQDADGGRLAGAVGAEHAEHRASPRREVDPVERLGVAEALDETFGLDGDVRIQLSVHPASIGRVARTPLARRSHRPRAQADMSLDVDPRGLTSDEPNDGTFISRSSPPARR